MMKLAVLGAIGAPDYDACLAHHRTVHADASPMGEAECFRYAIDRRYGKRGGGMRCG